MEKSFSAVLFSSFDELRILPCLDITDAKAASVLKSLGAAIVVFK